MPRVSSVDLECGGETRADARASEAPLGNEKTLIELRLEDLRRHGLVIVVDHEVNLRRVTKVARQALDLAPEVTAVRVRQFRPVRRAVGLDDAQHRTGAPAGFRVHGRGRAENADRTRVSGGKSVSGRGNLAGSR